MITLGLVTNLWGAAAGPFGVPARNAIEVMVEAANNGGLPAPYGAVSKKAGGVSLIIEDEGGPEDQAAIVERLARAGATAAIGWIGSGTALHAAHAAESHGLPMIVFNAGTSQLFDGTDRRFVFRTASTTTSDSVGAALYVSERMPTLKAFAGFHQDYPWGTDSWREFARSMAQLSPGARMDMVAFTPLYRARSDQEVAELKASRAVLVQSSAWGGDLFDFVRESNRQSLFGKCTMLLTSGESGLYQIGDLLPEGTVIGARGPNGPLAPATDLKSWFEAAYAERFATRPIYPAYGAARAFLALLAAVDRAGAGAVSRDELAAALNGVTFEDFSGPVALSLSGGRQAALPAVYGRLSSASTRYEPVLEDIAVVPAERVNPPDGWRSLDWIDAGFPAGPMEGHGA